MPYYISLKAANVERFAKPNVVPYVAVFVTPSAPVLANDNHKVTNENNKSNHMLGGNWNPDFLDT